MDRACFSFETDALKTGAFVCCNFFSCFDQAKTLLVLATKRIV
jgi:hypothetical protein